MTKNDFSEELIAPCGMNCRICLGYFGLGIIYMAIGLANRDKWKKK